MTLFLIPLAVVVAVALILRGRTPQSRARILKRAALALASFITFFIGMFVIGETFTDPGGVEAVGLIALWLLPMAALALLAWSRPSAAAPILIGSIALVIATSIWFALDTESWRSFEDDTGPVRGIASFALAFPLALLAWKRPRLGGTLLLVLAIVPVLVSGLGSSGAIGVLTVLSAPGVIVGLLYLAADAVDPESAPTVPATG